MNILVIGSGGREHAIVWKLAQSKKVKKIYVMAGNGGTALLAENLPGSETDFPLIHKYILDKNIDRVIVGPEIPLVEGIVDYFELKGIRVFGPAKHAAQLEGSKIFSKEFMLKYNIPTAQYEQFSDMHAAMKYCDRQARYPLVIKADGLASGKGVYIVQDVREAVKTLQQIMQDKIFGIAGNKVVIEEFLQGEEASILAFVDTKTIVPMVPAQDHKAAFDDDKGPNTGGMGAYSPAPIINSKLMEKINKEVFARVLEGFQKEGIIYRGVLYAGLMICKGEPKVLEFNARFGDPETQVVLPRLETDLVDVVEAVCEDRLSELNLKWKDEYAVCVVLASEGYPGSYEKGKEIKGLDKTSQLVFHAGTKLDKDKVITNGGRVLGVVALDKDLNKAIRKAYADVELIEFDNKMFRKDIGQKAFKHL
ncbi:MAG: phosphoribosylamine--glycine ligase [Candidatus Margulisbacteria bacterium]|nr:phosphoribosylamine--glycine ligase [Candidatus Margulisiibacteriota bacterium]